MPSKNKDKNKAISKSENAFFIYEEDKKDLGTPPTQNNVSNNNKNTLYIYKDKTTCRVCYDAKSDIYNEVHIG